MVLNLYRVLEITLYFSKSFSEIAIEILVAVKALWLLEVTIVYFLEQKSNL